MFICPYETLLCLSSTHILREKFKYCILPLSIEGLHISSSKMHITSWDIPGHSSSVTHGSFAPQLLINFQTRKGTCKTWILQYSTAQVSFSDIVHKRAICFSFKKGSIHMRYQIWASFAWIRNTIFFLLKK